MNIPALIQSMEDNGLAPEQIIAILKGCNARTSNADRQARYRERKLERNSNVTAVTNAPPNGSNGFPHPSLSSFTPAVISAPARQPISLPGWVPLQDWSDYTDWRKRQKGGFTTRMRELILNDLDRLRQNGHDPGEVLQQSLKGGWKSVHEIKTQGNANAAYNNRKSPDQAFIESRDRVRALAEAFVADKNS